MTMIKDFMPRSTLLRWIMSFTAVVVAGCGDGQVGRYIVTRNESGVSADGVFQYELLYGAEARTGRERLLLAVFFLLPESENFGAVEIGNGRQVSKVRATWQLPTGVSSAELAWNRVDGRIVIGDNLFQLSEGNLFLLLPERPVVQACQLAGVRESVNDADVITELKACLKRTVTEPSTGEVEE